MRVVWNKYAIMRRDQIAEYIRERFGADRRKRFLQEVRQATRMLKQFPNLGILDPLFAECQKPYRSIIVGGLSKMVYTVSDETIYIVALWDCRQEPEPQATPAANA